ncbi:MAG: Ig-like domain-containing protein, partial [Angustibacter sp.]
PNAVDNTASTPMDTNVAVSVLGNDTPGSASAPLDPASVKLKDPADGTFKTTVTIPGEGTYTVSPAGVVTFDPLPTFTGVTTPVTYQVADANGSTDTALLTITVQPPPQAVLDTGTTPQNVNITIQPVTNDLPSTGTGSPLDPTTVRIRSNDPSITTYGTTVTYPGQGTYTVNTATGEVTFDPLPTFTGNATPVSYQVKDGDGVPTNSSIRITVTGIVPTAVDDASATPVDTNVTLPIVGNDTPGAASAPLVPGSVQLLDPADNVYKTSVTIPSEGTYTVNPTTGAVTFDPEPAFLGATTPVTYRIADANGSTDTAKISITVTPNPPVAAPDTATTPQNVPVTQDVLANDASGTLNLDPTTVKIKDPADGTFKTTVTIPGEGKYTVDPATGKITFDPEPDFVGTATPVTYEVANSAGTKTSSTFT